MGSIALSLLSAYIGYTVVRDGVQQRIFKSAMASVFADLTFLPPTNPSTCRRGNLPSLDYYPGPRTYHEFGDVLLIVFFSHARYDVNLEYYKNVYSEFFPNVSSSTPSADIIITTINSNP